MPSATYVNLLTWMHGDTRTTNTPRQVLTGCWAFKAYDSQDDLIKALNSTDQVPYILSLKTGLRAVGERILDEAFDAHGVNVMAAPGDSSLCVHAAAAGYPIATAPLGQLRYNGRPFGLCVVAKRGKEELLLQFMAAHESSMAVNRPIPAL